MGKGLGMPELPRHLRGIGHVFVAQGLEQDPACAPLVRRVRSLLPGAVYVDAENTGAPPEVPGQGHGLWLKHYKGRFLRFCPGTRHYRCCGYRIAHIGENCPVGCSYCILQAYFQDRLLKVWANQGDLHAELALALEGNPQRRLRLGTGEFTDSLALEPLTGCASGLVRFLGDFPNACLELKSKVADLSWLPEARRPDRVLPAWSMNAPRIVAEQEGLAAPLEERLRAARHCASLGFRVCLHFDPVIRYPGWDDVRDGYPAAVEMIRDHLRPEQVAYISLGSFRFMPQLKGVIEANHSLATYIYEEYGPGLDNKQRLLRPLRVEQFRLIADALTRAGFGEALYFCMESDAVWQEVLGRTPRDLGGLAQYLEQRAFDG